MARHDALTNLPNRVLFREQLEQALRLAKRGDQLAVLCLDLDHFKDINDSLGHPVGDALLKEVAPPAAANASTEHDTVARLGGDEFAIVQIGAAARRLRRPRSPAASSRRSPRPTTIDGHQLVIGVSIGISLAPRGRRAIRTSC